MPRLSVIVPVYNVEAYIGACLDSLQAQTFSDFEIVCVNDGSPDRSRELIAQRAETDERIMIVDKENGGLSSARNAGIDAATAEFVCFLDADDTFAPTACEKIVEAFDSGCFDVVVFGGRCIPERGADRWIVERLSPRDVDYPAFEPALLFDEMSNPYIRVAARRQTLIDHSIRFDESLRFGEDEVFMFELYPQANGVKLISDKLYNYFQSHGGSLMDTARKETARKIDLDLAMVRRIFETWKHLGLLDEFATELVDWSVGYVLYAALRQQGEERARFVCEMRGIWLANCTDEQLSGIVSIPRSAQLVELVFEADDDGVLAADQKTLSAALAAWRLKAYGPADFARTASERIGTVIAKKLGREQSPRNGSVASKPFDPEHPLVSVLVPIYNTPEPQLRQCLDSLVGQTLSNLEIICINDGSTNDAPIVIADYAARDPRIRVLTKPNSGYGDSMNRGIEIARGTWIGICEPDDFADERMFETYVEAANRFDVELVKSNYYIHTEAKRRDRLERIYDGFPYETPFALSDHAEIVHVRPAIWSALYRRDVIVDNGIWFSPTPGAAFQDTSFVHRYWIAARTVVLLKDGFLHYRLDNEGSSSNKGDKAFAICGEYERTFDFLNARGPEAVRSFAPLLNVARFEGYLWNYKRIAPEEHAEFAERWAREMREAIDAGQFAEGLLDNDYRRFLDELLASPAAFCEAHPTAEGL